MVPLAIISNGMRIMITAIMAHYIGPKAAEGFMHEFSGWVIFVVATVLFLLLHSFVTYIRKKLGWYQGSGNLDLIPAAKVAQ
jgi:exosortase/archaeosortase family protein